MKVRAAPTEEPQTNIHPSGLKYITDTRRTRNSRKVSRRLGTSTESGFIIVTLGQVISILVHFSTTSLQLSDRTFITSASVSLVLGILAPVVMTVLCLVEIVCPDRQVAGGRLRRRLQSTRSVRAQTSPEQPQVSSSTFPFY